MTENEKQAVQNRLIIAIEILAQTNNLTHSQKNAGILEAIGVLSRCYNILKEIPTPETPEIPTPETEIPF